MIFTMMLNPDTDKTELSGNLEILGNIKYCALDKDSNVRIRFNDSADYDRYKLSNDYNPELTYGMQIPPVYVNRNTLENKISVSDEVRKHYNLHPAFENTYTPVICTVKAMQKSVDLKNLFTTVQWAMFQYDRMQ